jgi:tetratricopeptide (TPR) repeat protein
MAAMDAIRISLYGPLEIAAPDGTRLTPQGSRKVLGLVALLATAPGMRKPRQALQALLWSDRSAEQRSASLRQALSALRHALGAWSGVLVADRDTVAFDAARVALAPPAGPEAEFLAGLDIRDPEFDAWLRLERGLRRQQSPSPFADAQTQVTIGPPLSRPVLLFLREPKSNAMEALIGNLFADALARSLGEQFSIEIGDASSRRGDRHGPRDLVFRADALVAGGNTALRVTLETGGSRRRLWSGHRIACEHTGLAVLENDEVQRLVNEAVEGYADALLSDPQAGRHRLNAAVMGRLAVRQIFTMRPDLYAGADDLLDRAFYLDPRGIYLAWKVLLRVVRLVERHDVDVAATREQTVDLCRRAVEFEPLNSMVLSAASNGMMLVEGNTAVALEFAQRAVRLNPSNPFAWDGLSTAALHAGKLEEAYVFAVKSQRLAGNTPFKHWYDMGRALMATVTGRFDEALQLAGRASAIPHFKPPLRYIAALYARAGRPELAGGAVGRLRRLEPDFSPDRMIEDPAYPVAALRRSQILRRGLFGDIV